MFCVSNMPNTSAAEVKELQPYSLGEPRMTSIKSLSSHGLAECLKLAGEDVFPSIRTLIVKDKIHLLCGNFAVGLYMYIHTKIVGSVARIQDVEGKLSHGFTLVKSARI